MTHAGQEFGLGGVGALRHVAGLDQLAFAVPGLADVLGDAMKSEEAATRLVIERQAAEMQVARLSVFVQDGHLQIAEGGSGVHDGGLELLSVLGGGKVGKGRPQQGLRMAAQDLKATRRELGEAELSIGFPNHVGDQARDILEPLCEVAGDLVLAVWVGAGFCAERGRPCWQVRFFFAARRHS